MRKKRVKKAVRKKAVLRKKSQAKKQKRKKGVLKLAEKPVAVKETGQIGELLRVGKQRGFITEDEILKIGRAHV